MNGKKPFDVLCDIVEGSGDVSPVTQMVQDAKVFDLCGADEEEVQEVIDLSQADDFRLPFPTIAVQSPSFVCLISDTKEDQFVLYDVRKLTILDIMVDEKTGDPIPKLVKGRFYVDSSKHQSEQIQIEFEFAVCLNGQWKFGEEIMSLLPQEVRRSWEDRLAGVCQFSLMVMNKVLADTRNFILEESPVISPKQPLKPGRLRRTHQRPKYTVIRPNAARKIMGLPDPDRQKGTHAKPIAHERRGHWRHYRDDRYIIMQGRKRWIDHTWIGDSEAIVGNKQYRVILSDPRAVKSQSIELDDRPLQERIWEGIERRKEQKLRRKARRILREQTGSGVEP